MVASLTLFIISGAGIGALIVVKQRENLSGARSLSRLSDRFDLKITRLIDLVAEWIGRIHFKTVFWSVSIAIVRSLNHALDFLKISINALQKRFSRTIDLISGRQTMPRSAASSVYLKTIKAYKDEITATRESGKSDSL
jgi:hypothetical protein